MKIENSDNLFFFFFFCCGTHFTFLSEGYVCRLTNVYWGPSGVGVPGYGHLAWASAPYPPEDKAW